MATHIDDKAAVAHLDRAVSLHDDEKHSGANKLVDAKIDDEVAGNYIDPTVEISPEENKRIRWILYKKLLPVMCIAYITQSLDKGTLATSSIMGWLVHVNAQGQDYALSGTLLWIGVIVGEPIVNQCIRKFPVAKVLGGSMVIWSALVFGLAFSLSIPPVLAIRFLLGFFESSFSPCLMAITVVFFTKDEQLLISTIWTSMFAVAGITANLLGYGFLHIADRGYPIYGWQYMTVTIGIISVLATIACLIWLPDSPANARFLSEEDKKLVIERVRENDQGIKQKEWKKDQAREALTDPMTWSLCFMILLQTLVVGGFNQFNSLLINQAFGFDPKTAMLVSIPLSVFQVILYFVAGYLGTRFKNTILVMVSYACINIVGTVVLLTVTPSPTTRVGLLVTFYCMQAFQACHPSMYAMMSRNVAGQTKKSIVYAAFFVTWGVGNSVGPQLFQAAWRPRYFNSLYIHLGIYAVFIVNVMVMRTMLVRRNKRRDEALAANGGENLHLHAFEDRTDLQNQDFRYSY